MTTILHAVWLPADVDAGQEAGLAVWAEGELRRPKSPVEHPFALTASQVVYSLWQFSRDLPTTRLTEAARKLALALPSDERRPLASRAGGEIAETSAARRRRKENAPQLRPWRVEAAMLRPAQALNFLLPLPPTSPRAVFGPDFEFWLRAARLAALVIGRGRFLPLADEAGRGQWRAVLSDPELASLAAQLAQAMPPAARALARPLPAPAALLADFLSVTTADYLSQNYTPGRSPFYDPRKFQPKPQPPTAADLWWLDLFPRARHNLSHLTPGPEQPAFGERVRGWALNAFQYAASAYRLALRLEPPAASETPDSGAAVWRLSFHLQPKTDSEDLWAAHTIWEAPPQPELPALLRAGLGQAARTYPALAGALAEDCPTALTLSTAEAVDFLENQAAALSAQGFGVLVPAWWRERQRRLTARLSLGQQANAGLLGLDAVVDFDWQVAVGDQTLTLAELQQLAHSKTALVQVRGEWMQFNPQDVQAALRLVERHRRSHGKLSVREALSLALAGPSEWDGLAVDDVRVDGWLQDVIRRLSGHQPLERLEQPASFVGQLRPYQLNGLSWLAFMRQYGFGACLADDMGLGKTIQLLALLSRDLETGALTHPVLLVCPTTVVNNWVREAAQFLPTLKCYAHHGPQRLKGEAFVAGVAAYHLVITSYALLPRDAAFLEQTRWGGMVLDEAHNIKNPSTKQAQIARRLPAGYRFALTGTPLENRLQDLWSILHFLNPGYLGSAEAFQRNFAGPIERGADETAATRLRALTSPFILRRLKTDQTVIRDLPPKNEMKEYCGLTKEQAALYRAVTQEALRQIESAGGLQRRGIILATLTKLKQVCNHPRHLLGDRSALKHRSGKLNRLTEMLEQAMAEEDRVLIFTQYAEMGHLLQEYLSEAFGPTLYLHGGTPAARRAEMIAHFQENGARLFVLSLKAGGAGINLTRANRVFHYDRWWNPAVENQATDRAFRIGQTQAVQVHKFVVRGTLEERIDELITRKLALAGQIVGSGEHWLTELSTDELRDLLVLRREALDE
ncbi:MAG: DEAD/DEAH box helicase [Anaerolineales bacterium]|nr:DEAD/DEAH box helicase [Anaerolineales bacterium]